LVYAQVFLWFTKTAKLGARLALLTCGGSPPNRHISHAVPPVRLHRQKSNGGRRGVRAFSHLQLASRGGAMSTSRISSFSGREPVSGKKERPDVLRISGCHSRTCRYVWVVLCRVSDQKLINFILSDNARKMSLFSSLLLLFNGCLDEAMIKI